ncbi:hypothetical protein TNCV_2340331 [Trichonephila clavipes]|nr:hypothetical protein TNCV_2340331 [Trichonephila clavipes]
MDVCKCIVPSRHGGTLNSRRAGGANGNDKAVPRMYHAQFPYQQIPNHRIFQWLHRQLRETRSFHFTRHDAGRRTTISSPRMEESIQNIVPDRP